MKKLIILMLAVVLTVTGSFAAGIFKQSATRRIEKNIDTQWTFNYFPEEDADKNGYESITFDDSKWSTIAIPHTWMTYETTGELHPYIKNASAKDSPYWWDGWGWYRKSIIIGDEFKDKKIFFEFDGVQKYSKIWLNGKFLGDHKGGFNGFYVDATDAVKFGEENVLAVAVNNSLNDKFMIPPMNAGNWVVYGGIVRDVRLVIKDKVYIPFQGSYKHEGGTFVTTPVVDAKKGVVNVKTFVKNEENRSLNVTLKSIITKADNSIVATLVSNATIESGKIATFEQRSEEIKNPTLWSPENPYIYNVYSQVYVGDKLVDTYYSPLGFRFFHWDYSTDRLWLNGKEVRINGQNRHEEFPWIGAAFPKWIALRDMNDIRYNLEHNYMRTAHYPHDPSIYNFTDRNGIIINEEQPNIKNQEFDDEVQEQICRATIRRDRNHPSIFFWSMGNETTDAADSKWAHEEDTTRIITSRHIYNNSAGDFAPHSEKNMSIEGFLRCTIKGWYDTDEKDLEPTDSQHAGTEVNDVNRAIERDVQSHYGSVWLYADHGADREYVNAPLKHVNPKGWVDSWRNPKYKYYLWQANFATKPMVFIQYNYWRPQYIGQKKNIVVHSNCDEVELFVNGKSAGRQYPNAKNQFTLTFPDVLIVDGTIAAIAKRKDGKQVENKITMSGDPSKIVIAASRSKGMAVKNEIVEIKANIVDANGIPVIGANNPLKWDVSGVATLVGPELYNSDINQTEVYEGTMYIDVPTINLIRSTGKKGKAKVTVSSAGLLSGEIEIVFDEYQDTLAVKGISEPVLVDEGREAVKKNTEQITRIVAPEEMKEYTGELQYPLGDKENLRKQIRNFIYSENPKIDTTTVDFRHVINKFYQMMEANNGRLVADDYNFVVEQYNISREITRFIAGTKLPLPFKDQLAAYYSGLIVDNGRDKNFVNEKQLISLIPVGGKTVMVSPQRGLVKDVYYTQETDLQKIIRDLYPETKKFSGDEMKKALDLVQRINPYISYTYIRDRKTKIRTDIYTIEKEKVIYIPPVKSLLENKFPDKKI